MGVWVEGIGGWCTACELFSCGHVVASQPDGVGRGDLTLLEFVASTTSNCHSFC